ncbi:MAG: PmeII family type II restriction endonuclease [Mariprofundales bacterium]|nr:PmeII family type II restriction endonuclease [Mariprofundales bacterium]
MKTKQWFRDVMMENHIKNSRKLTDAAQFNINPFLAVYLANFLTGSSDAKGIAKALVYPRVLGTSITGSFGTQMQGFISEVLAGYGSAIAGIDIEFVDQVDGLRKYCQLKLGPNTINKDDVETISGHFNRVIRLAKTNNLRIALEDMVVGVLYGEPSQLSSHYRRIGSQYHFPVLAGADFWHRLTGDSDFFADLLVAIGEVAREADFRQELDRIIDTLAESESIQQLSRH